ncbi:hypothetical protein PHYSODRAFT_534717 [Phytophthora sojae]|uniref:Crinkler effector protein N-terminal domain-containing protein n=1 Tax=Phytophthora sojae (strain P6497) TaxID=1094619 RepID=G5AHC5_PHYSP|nr:hypothetical protein PHYSODRAFT_534717 [Phytophthora sojae]EGZ05103.1 hypothetical protein PHYSODRAFT_534717 [Phytophthora sojae]|eukprot:XP_009539475.1 hypothetical protein PHYSODRAFT_534717 [Phytophthora sojae]
MRLWCALVGERFVFTVRIDQDKGVDALKVEIKSILSSLITCDSSELQLFLAKKDDTWLLVEHDVEKNRASISGLKLLESQAFLSSVGLSEEDLVADKDPQATGDDPVHVIVRVLSGIDIVLEEDKGDWQTELEYYQQVGETIKDNRK